MHTCDICDCDVQDAPDGELYECWSCSREFCAHCGSVGSGYCKECLKDERRCLMPGAFDPKFPSTDAGTENGAGGCASFDAWMAAVLEEEGLGDWTVRVSPSGGYCWRAEKIIQISPQSVGQPGLFLHEVAHALGRLEGTRDEHHGYFADVFTRLVDRHTRLEIHDG